MRFILIAPRYRKAFRMDVPCQIREPVIERWVEAEGAFSVPLADDVDLWLPEDPAGQRFALAGEWHQGPGFVVGRSKLGDIKSLPRRITVSMIAKMLDWPGQMKRPVGLPRPAFDHPTTDDSAVLGRDFAVGRDMLVPHELQRTKMVTHRRILVAG